MNAALQEDPEIQDFKNAVADTAEDAKKSVQSADTKSTDTKATGSEKTVLEQVGHVHISVHLNLIPGFGKALAVLSLA